MKYFLVLFDDPSNISNGEAGSKEHFEVVLKRYIGDNYNCFGYDLPIHSEKLKKFMRNCETNKPILYKYFNDYMMRNPRPLEYKMFMKNLNQSKEAANQKQKILIDLPPQKELKDN